MNSKKVIIIAVISIGVIGYFFLNRQENNNQGNTPNISTPLMFNKSELIKIDLAKIDTPIVCNIIGSVEKARAERKSGEGKQVATKLFVKGPKIREEGISIFTDGSEKNTINIIDQNDTTYFSLLLDGSNRMTELNYDEIGGNKIVAQYNQISSDSISCKNMAFDEKILIPQNVCHISPSKNTPQCY